MYPLLFINLDRISFPSPFIIMVIVCYVVCFSETILFNGTNANNKGNKIFSNKIFSSIIRCSDKLRQYNPIDNFSYINKPSAIFPSDLLRFNISIS